MKDNSFFKKYHTDAAMSPSGKNWFRIESAFKPSMGDMEKAQSDLGFDPRGYGGPDNIELEIKSGMFITTFSCSGSCD